MIETSGAVIYLPSPSGVASATCKAEKSVAMTMTRAVAEIFMLRSLRLGREWECLAVGSRSGGGREDASTRGICDVRWVTRVRDLAGLDINIGVWCPRGIDGMC